MAGTTRGPPISWILQFGQDGAIVRRRRSPSPSLATPQMEERTPPQAEGGGSPLLSSAATIGVALPAGVPVPPASSRQPSGWSGATATAVGAVGPGAIVLGPNQKLVHLVRHAQGFHNVSELKIHLRPHDARLTPGAHAAPHCGGLSLTKPSPGPGPGPDH